MRSRDYHDPYADNHDDYPDDLADGPDEQFPVADPDSPLKQTPWFAMSIAFHAVLLLVVWSLVVSVVEIDEPDTIRAAVSPPEMPPPPTITPQIVAPERPAEPVDEPTEDPQITPDAQDPRNEDPTEQENQDLRPNEAVSESMVESDMVASPDSFNSSIGLGANAAGGGGPDGGGGNFRLRARGGPAGKPYSPHTDAALKWLADHQNPGGYWDAQTFGEDGARNGRTGGNYGNQDGTPDTGWEHSRTGLTGLALLAFLGAGHTHTIGEYRDTVKRALRYLRAIQDNDGCFDTTNREDHHYCYGHAICAMAMAEAFGMSGSNLLRGPAQKGVDFIADFQVVDPDLGALGWRYGDGDCDTSVTGWMALALKSARIVGLEVPDRCWDGALAHLDNMTGEIMGYPKTGYITNGGGNARLQGQQRFVPNASMDAINVMTRMFISKDRNVRNNPMVLSQADSICLPDSLPDAVEPTKRDYYYWYYASLAMFQMGGRHWKAWEKPMADAVVSLQRLEGNHTDRTYGSWDSDSAWGVAGGRVYATAINCLTLEVWYRYERRD